MAGPDFSSSDLEEDVLLPSAREVQLLAEARKEKRIALFRHIQTTL